MLDFANSSRVILILYVATLQHRITTEVHSWLFEASFSHRSTAYQFLAPVSSHAERTYNLLILVHHLHSTAREIFLGAQFNSLKGLRIKKSSEWIFLSTRLK